MRQIKFRAWDKDDKRLRDVTVLGLTEGFVSTTRTSGPTEDFVLMQFTGLLDKNGKEIYEGDIVRFPKEPKYKNTWRVIFQNGAFVLADGIGVRYVSVEERKDEYNNIFPPISEGEIIGNIYENPDLIK